MASACPRDYRVEHPCDVPYTLDSDGRCEKLIEDAIAENGPSRWIYMAYNLCISVVGFLILANRLRILWALAKQKRRQRISLLQFVLSSTSMQMRCCLVLYSVLMILHALDPDGYGGRIPFQVDVFLHALRRVAVAIGSLYVVKLWHEINLMKEKAGYSLKTVVPLGLAFSSVYVGILVMSVLAATVLVPEDAPRGVLNSPAMAVVEILVIGHGIVVVFLATLEYLRATHNLPAFPCCPQLCFSSQTPNPMLKQQSDVSGLSLPSGATMRAKLLHVAQASGDNHRTTGPSQRSVPGNEHPTQPADAHQSDRAPPAKRSRRGRRPAHQPPTEAANAPPCWRPSQRSPHRREPTRRSERSTYGDT